MKRIFNYLPEEMRRILFRLPDEMQNRICEVRLRSGGALSLSTYTKNLFVTKDGKITEGLKNAFVCTESDIMHTVSCLTEGSVYRYTDSVNRGYIVTRQGIRVGIVGEAVSQKGIVTAVGRYTALNIRIPHDIENSGSGILEKMCLYPNVSVLIYSPPGYGKTTVLRSIAKGLGEGKAERARRVSVIDERAEILPNGSVGLIDRLVGYSKPVGIEIAVRAFSPEYVICDEIGLSDDVEAILSVQNTGVPFVATTHGSSLEEIKRRPNIRRLLDSGAFTGFVKLDRVNGECVSSWEKI